MSRNYLGDRICLKTTAKEVRSMPILPMNFVFAMFSQRNSFLCVIPRSISGEILSLIVVADSAM